MFRAEEGKNRLTGLLDASFKSAEGHLLLFHSSDSDLTAHFSLKSRGSWMFCTSLRTKLNVVQQFVFGVYIWKVKNLEVKIIQPVWRAGADAVLYIFLEIQHDILRSNLKAFPSNDWILVKKHSRLHSKSDTDATIKPVLSFDGISGRLKM